MSQRTAWNPPVKQQVHDARAHDPAAQHGDFFDLGRLEILDARQPSRRTGVEENPDEVLGHIREQAVGKEAGLHRQVGVEVVAQTPFEGFDGLERRHVPLGLGRRHELGEIEQGLLLGRTRQPVVTEAGHPVGPVELTGHEPPRRFHRRFHQLIRFRQFIDQGPGMGLL